MTYFFVHTPKTSGTTFVDVLNRDPDNKVGFFYPPKEEMHKFEKRTKEGPIYHLEKNPDWQKFNFIVGHFTFGIHETFNAKDFSYIGVTREPVSHYISTYKALLRMSQEFQGIILTEQNTLDNFLKLDYTHNMQAFYLSGLSQKEIREDKERAYQVSIENSEKYFTGVYPTESFDEGLFYFQHKAGIKPQFYLKKNVARNKIQEGVSAEAVEKIKQINDVDIRLYEYFRKKFDADLKEVPFLNLKVAAFQLMNKAYGLLK